MQKDFLKILKNEPERLGSYFGFNDLTKLHGDWIKYLFDSKTHRAIRAHRESYKTSTLILGIIRELILNPEITILILRKTDTDASMVLQSVAKKIKSEKGQELFKAIHGVDKIEGDVWTNSKVNLSIKKKITVECNLECIGIGGSVTGKHPDMIIVDDIITLKDRVSKAEREFVKIYIQELINVVRNDGKIIFTGTPWHKDDAWGMIGNIAGSIKDYDCYSTGILTTQKIHELRRTITPSMFAANYELKHIVEEGRIFKNPYFERLPDMRLIAYLDPSYSGDNHTALSVGGVKDGKIYLTGKIWDKHVSDVYSDIISTLKSLNVGTLYVESNGDKGYSARDLSRLRGGFVKTYHESTNQHIRIIHYLYKHWERVVFIEGTEPDYINEILDYQEGQEPDDAPDSAAGLIRIILSILKNKS